MPAAGAEDRDCEDTRAQFEEIINGMPFERPIKRYPNDATKTAWPGDYIHSDVSLAWAIWQAALSAALQSEPERLAETVQVGNTIFNAGIKVQTVINRARREYLYQQEPEQQAERLSKAKAFQERLFEAFDAASPPQEKQAHGNEGSQEGNVEFRNARAPEVRRGSQSLPRGNAVPQLARRVPMRIGWQRGKTR